MIVGNCGKEIAERVALDLGAARSLHVRATTISMYCMYN